MTANQLDRYRQQLWETVTRLQQDASLVSRQAVGTAVGRLRDESPTATMHLDDLGSESYLQELNATLLENEEFLANQALAAIRRIDEGTYGRCEDCGQTIIKARLDAIPSTRFCTDCAERRQTGTR